MMSSVLERVRHRLTTTDYHRMGEAGVFDDNDRVELIDGAIIDMAPIGNIRRSRFTVRRPKAFIVKPYSQPI